MQAQTPAAAATSARSDADALAERLARADLVVPALPPPPLPPSAKWTEFVLHDARSLSKSQSELLDDDALSLLGQKQGGDGAGSSISLYKSDDCQTVSSDLTRDTLDLFDTHELSNITQLNRMSAPTLSTCITKGQDEDVLLDALELIAETQLRMDNQRASPPSRAMPRRSSAPSASALLPRPPLNGMVTRLRGRQSKRTQHAFASRSCSSMASQPGMRQHLDHLLSQLEAASGNRLEGQRAQPPLLSIRHARTQSQPEFAGQTFSTTPPRLSFVEGPDTQNLFDSLERAGRNLDQQRASPPAMTLQVPMSAPPAGPGRHSSRSPTSAHGITLVERLRGTGKRLDGSQYPASDYEDVAGVSPRNRLRQGGIHIVRAISSSLPGKRHSAVRQSSPLSGAHGSKRRMSKLGLRLHPTGSRSTSASATSPSAHSSQADHAYLSPAPSDSVAASNSTNGTVLCTTAPPARTGATTLHENSLPIDSVPSPLTASAPLGKSANCTTPIQLYTEWQVHLHTLVVLVWAKDGDAIPVSATACLQDHSSKPFEVHVTLPETTSSPQRQRTVIIQPPAHVAVPAGSSSGATVSFAGKGTFVEPLRAKLPCAPPSGLPAPEAHEGDSMGLAGLPRRLEGCVCKKCDAQLILPHDGGRRLLPLPSAGWEELVDAWMCHEDQLINRAVQRGKEVLYPDRDGLHATANTPHANTVFASEFWLVPKLANISPGAVRWVPGFKRGRVIQRPKSTDGPERPGSFGDPSSWVAPVEYTCRPEAHGRETLLDPGNLLVRVTSHGAHFYIAQPVMGSSAGQSKKLSLQWDRKVKHDATSPGPLLASACDLGAERRVELVDDGSSPSDAKAPETRIWLFQPLAYVAARTSADGTIPVLPAMKVLFRGPPEASTNEFGAATEAVPLPLPAPVRRDLLALLQERHACLPAPLADAFGWQAAWL